jgi:hypothetical protein
MLQVVVEEVILPARRAATPEVAPVEATLSVSSD